MERLDRFTQMARAILTRAQMGKEDKFTDRARKVLTLAQEEAQLLNHNYIGTEHLLLGLVREGDGVAARVLAQLGIGEDKVRHAVEFIVGRGEGTVAGELGLTPRTKRVLEFAVEEANRLTHNYVGTEHLLLGLVREGEGVGARVLVDLGVQPSQVHEQIMRILRSGDRPAGPKGNVVACRIDDRDLDALDALIEAGIRTTRSDAAAWLIRAGIEANQPLFEKVYATVAEIRRLRAEAQSIAGLMTVSGAPQEPPSAEQPSSAGAAAPAAGAAQP